MARILVVDDSKVDRVLIGGLLGSESDLEVEHAENGGTALEHIAQDPPDLVITDLVMPEMDGWQLVAEIRENHPLVPVILVTSQGSEGMAVRALKEGAASYVPKAVLAEDLVDTVRNVLAASTDARTAARLMKGMIKSSCSFVLENDRRLIAPLVTYLQENMTRMGLCDDSECTRIGIALEEALVNAVEHGNLEMGSELRETDRAAYDEMIVERRGRAPYNQRRVNLDATLSPTEARFVVRDEGPGFDPSSLPDPTDPKNLLKASGRGILLMRTFMDEVSFNSIGNHVEMVKRCGESGSSA